MPDNSEEKEEKNQPRRRFNLPLSAFPSIKALKIAEAEILFQIEHLKTLDEARDYENRLKKMFDRATSIRISLQKKAVS